MDTTTQMILDIIQAEEEHEVRMRMAATYLHNRQHIPISHHGGSVVNHRVINRKREEAHNRLYHDYFFATPTYTYMQFRRRFRMSRSLFLRIKTSVAAHDNYFTQRTDVVGVPSLSSLQKIKAALRMLAHGITADSVDDYVRIGESATIESLKRFVKAIVEVFGAEYLRRSNNDGVSRLLAENGERGFPGMWGSIDCMHWKWKNCLTGWEDRSHLFEDLVEGRGPQVQYTINENVYKMGYYLVDDIYPFWPTFFKTIPKPQGNKRKYFVKAQESVRKDVERAFGVLQSRFSMIRGPSHFWDMDNMKYIMIACIILHNMIIEDERELNMEDEHFDTEAEIPTITPDVIIQLILENSSTNS